MTKVESTEERMSTEVEDKVLRLVAEEEAARTGTLAIARHDVGPGLVDLTAVGRLSHLRLLDCAHTGVRDLSPVAAISGLQALDCAGTKVADLGPLSGLTQLVTLKCPATAVTDLTPISNLRNLTILHCFMTAIKDLSPVVGLTSLKHLNVGITQISDISAVANLKDLEYFTCNDSEVSNLEPVRSLTKLNTLFCGGTKISSVEPLRDLVNLTILNMGNNQVTDLTPISGLSKLENLSVSNLNISKWDRELFYLPNLRAVVAAETRIRGIPSGVLSKNYGENCLPSLRSHFASLERGAEIIHRAKIILLGNGRVGKTQLARWLLRDRYRSRGEPVFEKDSESTHGVRVVSDEITVPGMDESQQLGVSVWDFGGQDIYHGTHSLFLTRDAIFILCWNPQQEDCREQEWGGFIFRNYPLAYWVDYVRRLAGLSAPLLIVQTHCDSAGQEQRRSHPGLDLEDFQYPPRELAFGAEKARGGLALAEAVGDAADWLLEQTGDAVIGAGRKAIIDRLEQWRSDDSELPAEQRRHKLLTQQEYQALCAEFDEDDSEGHLLEFLHRSGIVFYQKDLFNDAIVLDQNWALTAIYSVFNREHSYRPLQAMGGHFTPTLLNILVWGDYSVAEQALFVSMMESCGIAFLYRQDRDDPRYCDYIAPDLLPPRQSKEAEIRLAWHDEIETLTARMHYPLLHPGLVREIISGIGGQAGSGAVYWRGGVLFYAAQFRSNVLVEEEMDEAGWSGTIRISCQQGDARAALDHLQDWITAISKSMRMIPEVDLQDDGEPSPETPAPATAPLRRNPARRAWYVSYAWGDQTPEGQARNRQVDDLCERAARRGVEIIRDVTHASNGDSIMAFMDRLSRGDRIIVILSDRYLHSEFCMYELYEIWRNRPDESDFASAIRAYKLDSARISTWQDRARIARFWRERVEEVRAYERDHSGADIGARDAVKHRLMQRYGAEVSDILSVIEDRVSPKDWESFLEYAFDPDPGDDV